MQLWWVGLAAAAGLAARHTPFEQGAGEHEPDFGQDCGVVGHGVYGLVVALVYGWLA